MELAEIPAEVQGAKRQVYRIDLLLWSYIFVTRLNITPVDFDNMDDITSAE